MRLRLARFDRFAFGGRLGQAIPGVPDIATEPSDTEEGAAPEPVPLPPSVTEEEWQSLVSDGQEGFFEQTVIGPGGEREVRQVCRFPDGTVHRASAATDVYQSGGSESCEELWARICPTRMPVENCPGGAVSPPPTAGPAPETEPTAPQPGEPVPEGDAEGDVDGGAQEDVGEDVAPPGALPPSVSPDEWNDLVEGAQPGDTIRHTVEGPDGSQEVRQVCKFPDGTTSSLSVSVDKYVEIGIPQTCEEMWAAKCRATPHPECPVAEPVPAPGPGTAPAPAPPGAPPPPTGIPGIVLQPVPLIPVGPPGLGPYPPPPLDPEGFYDIPDRPEEELPAEPEEIEPAGEPGGAVAAIGGGALLLLLAMAGGR